MTIEVGGTTNRSVDKLAIERNTGTSRGGRAESSAAPRAGAQVNNIVGNGDIGAKPLR